MKNKPYIFNLKVQKIEQNVEQLCLFELTWGEGQRLNTQISYPQSLNQFYQDWRKAYFNFYQSEQMRGRVGGGGIASLNLDWHAELIKTETKLMYEFNRWLRSAELYDIRSYIAQASQELVKTQSENNNSNSAVQVFVTCMPMELNRYPWEAWEIGTEFATTGAIQIIRAPLNIANETGSTSEKKRGSAGTRILAILGDDTGLNFKADRDAVNSLLKIADVNFVGWQPEQTPAEVIKQIKNAITDKKGWDILFFAGHSNETDLTGGELGIAPGVSISISEIASELSIARKRGLNVAIFNSCSGLNIAESLIDLGFGQVVVMREPIHNRVAQEFLVNFLQGLGKRLDIYDSMMEAKQNLRMEKSHTYPSSYLVPSLFCHLGAELYRIPQFGWKDKLRQNLPNRIESIILATSLILGTIPPIQTTMLNTRMLTTAVYRHATTQIPNQEAPPIALVEIDTESIYRAQLPDSQLRPFNRSYLAKLINSSRKLNASVVGVDFILDTPQKNPPSGDKDLGIAVRQAVDANMWLVFGAVLTPEREVGINESLGITKWNWTLQGYLNAFPEIVELPDPNRDCRNACPISYLISLIKVAQQEIPESLPKPTTKRTTNLRAELLDVVEKKQSESSSKTGLARLVQPKPPFGIQPLVDYSLPPQQIYTKIPAWRLIENPDINKIPLFSEKVVLIAVGSDERLGIAPGESDRMPIPPAMSYWMPKKDWMTGAESLAYMTHHFLRNRMVTPIPDIWIIGVAVIFSKIMILLIERQSSISPKLQLQLITGSFVGVILYGIAALQLYISAAVLLPWLLPSAVFLGYIIPAIRRNNYV
ncbi:MAG: CHASE2 domain-containing protein [Cyanobacteria bacterium P01_A01_bin.84]